MTPRAATVAEIPNTSAVRTIRDRALRSIVLAWCNGIVSPSWPLYLSSSRPFTRVLRSVAGELPARLHIGASTMIGTRLGSRVFRFGQVYDASDKCKRRNKDLPNRVSCAITHTQRVQRACAIRRVDISVKWKSQQMKDPVRAHLAVHFGTNENRRII